MIAAQVKAGEALGIPSEQIANGEFFAQASNNNWAAPASTSTPSADPAPTPKRTRVEVPHLVIVPNIKYYNPVLNSPSMLSPAPNIAAGFPAPSPGTTESTPSASSQPVTAPWPSNQPQGSGVSGRGRGCIPRDGGARSCCMSCLHPDLSLA